MVKDMYWNTMINGLSLRKKRNEYVVHLRNSEKFLTKLKKERYKKINNWY